MSEGWAVPSTPGVWRTCSMCGARSDDEADVHPAMWPTRSVSWEAGARCSDRAGCRSRVEAKGGAWPVADGTPASPDRTAETAPPDPHTPHGATRDDPDEWSFDR